MEIIVKRVLIFFVLLVFTAGCGGLSGSSSIDHTRGGFKKHISRTAGKNIHEKYIADLPYLDSVKALTDMAALCLAINIKTITQDGDQTIKKSITYMPTMKFREGEVTEFTVKMTTNPKRVGEPEGGFFVLAVDMVEGSEDKTSLDIYALAGHRRDISETIVQHVKDWASAESGDCPEL